MGAKSIQGSTTLAKIIRQRRIELNLTIEAAAVKAGVGIKTWCRYEAGGSIRIDKCKGICKALNWRVFPDNDVQDGDTWTINKYKEQEAWSTDLAERFGETAAVSFVIGSDILLDDISEDLQELSTMPRGSHLGQLRASLLANWLPRQFLMRYDYDFLYKMYITLQYLRMRASSGAEMLPHSVMEEILFYLSIEHAEVLVEAEGFAQDKDWKDWVNDLCGDCDLKMYLYSDCYIDEDHIYHFDRWMDQQFWVEEKSKSDFLLTEKV